MIEANQIQFPQTQEDEAYETMLDWHGKNASECELQNRFAADIKHSSKRSNVYSECGIGFCLDSINLPGLSSTEILQKQCFVFREAASGDELLNLLRLRYQVYRGSHLAKLISENVEGFDLDCLDHCARHFGLYENSYGFEIPVGYLRVVEDRTINNNGIWDELIGKNAGVLKSGFDEPAVPFPMMTYLPPNNGLLNIYNDFKSRRERLIEACRFAILPEFRSLPIARHIVESGLAVYFFYYGYEHAAWCCNASNSAFYRKYGLRQLEGLEESDFLQIGTKSSCLIGSASEIPNRMRGRIIAMAREYEQFGSISLALEQPVKNLGKYQENSESRGKSLIAKAMS